MFFLQTKPGHGAYTYIMSQRSLENNVIKDSSMCLQTCPADNAIGLGPIVQAVY